MATWARVDVDGLIALRKQLRAIDKTLPRELYQINKRAVGPLVDELKRTAPVQKGKLKKTIRPKAGQGEVAINIGSKVRVPYAGPVIGGDGTRMRPRPQGGYMRPNKFVKKAMKKKVKEVREIWERDVHKLVERVLG